MTSYIQIGVFYLSVRQLNTYISKGWRIFGDYLTFKVKVVANKDFGCQQKWILTHLHCTTCLPHAKSRFSAMSTIPISSNRRVH